MASTRWRVQVQVQVPRYQVQVQVQVLNLQVQVRVQVPGICTSTSMLCNIFKRISLKHMCQNSEAN